MIFFFTCAHIQIKINQLRLRNLDKIRTLGKKRKRSNTWASWKLTQLNKWRRKKKIKNEYLRRTSKLLETKLSSRNLIKGLNTKAIHSLDIRDHFWSGSGKNLSKWTKEQENKWPCIRHYIPETTLTDYMYQERREEEDLLASVEDSVNASIQRLEDYIEKHEGRLITANRERYWQHGDQQNDNNYETKIGRKTTLWAF